MNYASYRTYMPHFFRKRRRAKHVSLDSKRGGSAILLLCCFTSSNRHITPHTRIKKVKYVERDVLSRIDRETEGDRTRREILQYSTVKTVCRVQFLSQTK